MSTFSSLTVCLNRTFCNERLTLRSPAASADGSLVRGNERLTLRSPRLAPTAHFCVAQQKLPSSFGFRLLLSQPFPQIGPAGFEPATKGLCLPLQFSLPLSSLWSGPYLHFTCLPSGLYTFRCKTNIKLALRRLGSGLA